MLLETLFGSRSTATVKESGQDHVAYLPDAKPGLERCTVVSANALLAHFHRAEITSLAQVPHNAEESLEVLLKHGLRYKREFDLKPQSIAQFVRSHPRGAWYVGTMHHAMAVIDGELFDTEEKGLDGRQVKLAAEIVPEAK